MDSDVNYLYDRYEPKHKNMPNPYDDILKNNKNEEKKPWDSNLNQLEYGLGAFEDKGKEPLCEILDKIATFNEKAEPFTELLTRTRATEHKVDRRFVRIFIEQNDKHDRGNLAGERRYYQIMLNKFEALIAPMRNLALSHLDTIEQFNSDIDKNYFSIEKSEKIVRHEIKDAIDGIQFQRRILAEAAEHLEILEDGLEDVERRLKKYINIGGINNISNSEYEMISRKRNDLTSGRNHSFNYSVFDINLLDKTVITLGIYMKETTTKYLSKLQEAFRVG